MENSVPKPAMLGLLRLNCCLLTAGLLLLGLGLGLRTEMQGMILAGLTAPGTLAIAILCTLGGLTLRFYRSLLFQAAASPLIPVDLSEQANAEAILRDNEERFRAIFEQAGVGMAILTLEGYFFRINQKLCDLLGYSRLELFTQRYHDLLVEEAHQDVDALAEMLLTGERSSYCAQQQYRRQDGSWLWGTTTLSLIRDAEGMPKYFIGVIEDISLQQAALQEREAAEESLRALLNAIQESAFLIDTHGMVLQGNQAIAHRLQTPLEELVGSSIATHLPPDIAEIYRHQAKTVLSTGQPSQFNDLVEGRHYENSIYPISDRDGYITRLAVFSIDLTESKQAEDALKQANAQLLDKVTQLELRHQEMVLLGKMNSFLQVCRSVAEAHRMVADLLRPLFPHCSGELFRLNATEQWMTQVAAWGELHTSQSQFPMQHCWALRRSQPHWGTASSTGLLCPHIHHHNPPAESLCLPMFAQGEIVGSLHLSSLIAGSLDEAKQQLAHTVAEHLALALASLELRETLKTQSTHDPLTGLYNRRFMVEALSYELQRSQRHDFTFCVVMLDVDHFKQFNDTFGHDAGDLVLRALGQLLRQNLREKDLPCRYGGEEIVLILPEIDCHTCYQRAEMIRRQVEALHLETETQSLNGITVSMGLACFPEHGHREAEIMQAADTALYTAKHKGRNCTVVAQQRPVAEHSH
ncbi:diguanylate cyclase [Spirulina sp. CCNP1310]|nr:diguanylate cyclase [Spirulina sp. CCNP1310]